MAGTVHDLETARARRMGPRLATTAELRDGLLVVTFPRPIERLELTAAKVEYWISMLEGQLPALKAAAAEARAAARLPPEGKAALSVVADRDGDR